MTSIFEDLESIRTLAEEIKPVTKRDLLHDLGQLAVMHSRYNVLVADLGFLGANRQMESEFSDEWDYHKEAIWRAYDDSISQQLRGDL
jgi:hypothetical protein